MTEQPLLTLPHLQAALFCEKVLQEADGVVSLIRVVDRFTVPGGTPHLSPTPLSFTIVVAFKSGFVRGKYLVRIRPVSPSGKDLPALELPVLFEGDDDRGISLVLPTQFLVEEEGVFWFRVFVESDEVTRMPLRVFYRQQAIPMGG